ncbi:hypothetical protein FOA43_001492 [Brettanomyces nanus]|uniref:Nuclear speckle splicing regulatory protein 1 N-terminal domain-containing protein n=1 Tax=Eeniella nana TaxID=13502 RepID=A0A875RZL1_EENNA|nr:uncharacterized protein FOA43_001492 [Brettanomyces nanus]QPG74168.1 hypothetical protein FOA43_001492 [Brettanomyces nanus]
MTPPIKQKNLFGQNFDDNESDSDNDRRNDQRQYMKRAQRRVESAEKDLATEDTSVYSYDEVYDQISSSNKSRRTGSSQKSSRYIEGLRNAKKERELEKLRRIEDKIKQSQQKVITDESLRSKEAFVTESYKKYKDKLNKKVAEMNEEVRTVPEITFERTLLDMYGTEKENSKGENKNSHEPPLVPKAAQSCALGGGLNVRKKPSLLNAKLVKFLVSRITPEELEAYKQRYLLRKRS